MTTYTFAQVWFDYTGFRGDFGWGAVSITVPDGEVITSGDVVTLHTENDGDKDYQYQGLAADGSAGFTNVGAGGVLLELTNVSHEVFSVFPSAEDFDTSLPLCFLPGTLITTPEGSKAVEDLAIGDLVLTADGRAVPVKWVGRQTVHTTFGIEEGRRPVCVSAGALGGGLPVRDLKLTADHALLIDGVLVHAGALVNGTTIRRMAIDELGQRFTVYHVETESHDVILAEGTPAETFIDNVSRARFDNYVEYEAPYGAAPAPMAELSHPRAMSRRQVPTSILARTAAVAAQIVPQGEQAA